MSGHHPFDGPPDDEPLLEAELVRLERLLGDEAVWEQATPGLEEAIVTAIRAEADAKGPTPVEPADHEPGPMVAPADAGADVLPFTGPTRRLLGPLLGAAAALLVVAGLSLGSRLLESETPSDHVVAMAGTDLAPDATAVAEVLATPLGTRIVLDVTDLAPAPAGRYYEAWLRQNAEVGVSAGTFHLRGGDGAIELWAGVTVDDYPLITVTLQDEGAGAASSGLVVLKGSIED